MKKKELLERLANATEIIAQLLKEKVEPKPPKECDHLWKGSICLRCGSDVTEYYPGD